MKQRRDPIFEHLWRFVRDSLPAARFEQWVYGEQELESELGDELYLETIATDFSDPKAVWRLQLALGRHLRPRTALDCWCIRLKDVDVVSMGTFWGREPAFDKDWSDEDALRNLDEVKARGDPYWWIWAARCRVCGQGWLVGQDDRQNDLYCVRRLDDEELEAIEQDDRWPADFDTYESLLRIGLQAGRSVTYLDPLGDSLLDNTMALLAKERPGIAVSELAVLLNLDLELAAELARRAVEQEAVEIAFDVE